MQEIAALKFTAPPKAMATNTKRNLGFCMETLNGKYDFETCATEDSKDEVKYFFLLHQLNF